MTWLQFSVFEFLLDCLPHGRRLAEHKPAARPAVTHQEMLTLRAAEQHLEMLHTPHVLSGPGARLFQHLV